MKKLLILLFFSLFELACANSMGWPKKDPLPSTFLVSASIPQRWGSQLAFDTYSTIRVSFRNNSESEITILNLNFSDFIFVNVGLDGVRAPLKLDLGKLRAPSTNPSMILGPHSQVAFDIEMKRLDNPLKSSAGSISFEGKVNFVLGKVVDIKDFERKSIKDYGALEGFEYTSIIHIKDGARLLK